MAYREIGTPNTYTAYLGEMEAYRFVPMTYEQWQRMHTTHTKENELFT